MNRETRKRSSTDVQDNPSRNHEPRTELSRKCVGRKHRGSQVRGRVRVCTVNLSASMSRRWSRTVMEQERNRANVEQAGFASTETDDLGVTPSGPQPVPVQKSLEGDLPTPVTNVGHDVFAQHLKVLSDVLAGENTRNKAF